MSELLQDDDPDPQPRAEREYPVNWQTGEAYDDYESAEYYGEQHHLSLEREAIERLSSYASRILDSPQAIGPQTERRAMVEGGELYRKISEGMWMFSFIDTIDESRRRCRVWTSDGNGVNWCEDEQRYEPAEEVAARLEAMFSLEEAAEIASTPSGLRFRRLLALLAFRTRERSGKD